MHVPEVVSTLFDLVRWVWLPRREKQTLHLIVPALHEASPRLSEHELLERRALIPSLFLRLCHTGVRTPSRGAERGFQTR